MKRPGFFLVEFLIYLGLFSIVMFICMQMIISKSRALKSIQTSSQEKMELYAALDAVSSFLEKAPCLVSSYYLHSDQALIWHEGEGKKDTGIMLENKKLYYVQGLYDLKNSTWRSRKKTRLLERLDASSIELHKKEYNDRALVQGITLTLARNTTTAKKTIALLRKAVS